LARHHVHLRQEALELLAKTRLNLRAHAGGDAERAARKLGHVVEDLALDLHRGPSCVVRAYQLQYDGATGALQPAPGARFRGGNRGMAAYCRCRFAMAVAVAGALLAGFPGAAAAQDTSRRHLSIVAPSAILPLLV